MPQNRIREIREQRGLSQTKLALMLGVHPASVSRWESGKQGVPDVMKQHLAEVLRVSVPHLFGWDEPQGNGHNGEQAA